MAQNNIPDVHDENQDMLGNMTDAEALEEVKKAKRKVAWNKKKEQAFELMKRHHDKPEKLWQIAYDWLIESNPDARKDVEAVIEDCRQLRETRKNTFARGEEMNLRYGMRIPSIVLETLSLIDPRIPQVETLDPAEAKRIYRNLEKTFPQFRIPRND